MFSTTLPLRQTATYNSIVQVNLGYYILPFSAFMLLTGQEEWHLAFPSPTLSDLKVNFGDWSNMEKACIHTFTRVPVRVSFVGYSKHEFASISVATVHMCIGLGLLLGAA